MFLNTEFITKKVKMIIPDSHVKLTPFCDGYVLHVENKQKEAFLFIDYVEKK